jgi:hypothetical protein
MILLFCIITSCSGPTGPVGSNAVLEDTVLPTIEWITPEPELLIDSSVTLSVHAYDDHTIWQVTFFIAGFEVPAVMSDSAGRIYSYQWDCRLYPDGPYPLAARAIDDSRNASITPERLVHVRHLH